MHEPDEHPLRDQRRLDVDDPVEERQVGVLRGGRLGVVAGEGVVGEPAHEHRVVVGLVGRRVLERADAQVARGHPGEHRPGQQRLPHDLVAGGHHRERPRRGDAQRVHRLADHELAQHRADGGLAVAAPGERRAARALECHVAPPAVDVGQLAEQQRPAVAEAGLVPAELVPGVGLRDRRGPVGEAVAGQQGDAGGRAQGVGGAAQLGGQVVVEQPAAGAPATTLPATVGAGPSAPGRRSCRARAAVGRRRPPPPG